MATEEAGQMKKYIFKRNGVDQKILAYVEPVLDVHNVCQICQISLSLISWILTSYKNSLGHYTPALHKGLMTSLIHFSYFATQYLLQQKQWSVVNCYTLFYTAVLSKKAVTAKSPFRDKLKNKQGAPLEGFGYQDIYCNLKQPWLSSTIPKA